MATKAKKTASKKVTKTKTASRSKSAPAKSAPVKKATAKKAPAAKATASKKTAPKAVPASTTSDSKRIQAKKAAEARKKALEKKKLLAQKAVEAKKKAAEKKRLQQVKQREVDKKKKDVDRVRRESDKERERARLAKERDRVKKVKDRELERQRQILMSFRNNPEISEEALNGALYEIEQASSGLLAMAGKIGQYLRENEWLMGIRGRAAIPGGVCQFDLPSYHFWLNRDPEARRRDLAGWMHPMAPIRDGIEIVLRLLRGSGRPEQQLARGGAFQLTMAGRTAQMVRVRLTNSEAVVPEISANKYALNVRFMLPETIARPRQAERDVAFELTFCSL